MVKSAGSDCTVFTHEISTGGSNTDARRNTSASSQGWGSLLPYRRRQGAEYREATGQPLDTDR
jgi:hypothetical protein